MPEIVDTVIDGGIVAFSSNAFESSIAIKGEKIVAVGNKSTMPKANNYIDATGKYVLPGLIDCHVHIREKPGDDWGIGSKAAALAGLTTIIPFGEYNSEKKENDEIGKAIRLCTLEIESTKRHRKQNIKRSIASKIEKYCSKTMNRQFFDMAGSTLGRFGFFEKAINLYKQSIKQDENSINSRIGLIVSMSLSKQYKKANKHIRWLLKNNVTDLQVLRLGIQSGMWGNDKELANTALSILKRVNPALSPMAERFVNSAIPKSEP